MRQSLLWAIALFTTLFLGNGPVLASPSLFLKPQITAGMALGMAPVEVGKPFQLKLNARATLKGSGLTMKFLKVKEDSRCPTGTACVWAGRTVVVVNLIKNGKSLGDLELTHSPAQPASKTGKIVAGYKIQLVDLSPHPAASQTIDPASYVGSFLISRVSQA